LRAWVICLSGEAHQVLEALVDEQPCLEIGRAPLPHSRNFALRQLDLQRRYDFESDLVLKRKNVFEGAVIGLTPHMVTGGGIHELHRDAYLGTRPLHAAL
jgi:hypothetical protein